jgi:hypothetical protein
MIWNPGEVSNYATVDVSLPVGGEYKLILNNKAGRFWISTKMLSGMLTLNYYRYG